jgi:hypothetical protein
MRISTLVQLVNHKLADELLSQKQMLVYLDAVIDDINTALSTNFPTITEVLLMNDNTGDIDYGMDADGVVFMPDKYIRSVIVPGAAIKFYEVDEEGNNTAPLFMQQYQQNLFYMQRDYIFSIPEKYTDRNRGVIRLSDKDIKAPAMKTRTWPFEDNTGWR